MKTFFIRFFSFSLLVLLMAGCASTKSDKRPSQLEYNYKQLKLNDLDDMSKLMTYSVQKFKQSENPEDLKRGLLWALSRPDEDGVLEKVIGMVRTPLEDADLWETAVDELVSKSINVIENDQQPAVDQVTYSVVLENMISELRPEFVKQYKSPGFEAKVIERIAQSKIELLPQARAEKSLHLMKATASPSVIAQRLVDRRDESVKKEKAAQEKVENPD